MCMPKNSDKVESKLYCLAFNLGGTLLLFWTAKWKPKTTQAAARGEWDGWEHLGKAHLPCLVCIRALCSPDWCKKEWVQEGSNAGCTLNVLQWHADPGRELLLPWKGLYSLLSPFMALLWPIKALWICGSVSLANSSQRLCSIPLFSSCYLVPSTLWVVSWKPSTDTDAWGKACSRAQQGHTPALSVCFWTTSWGFDRHCCHV